MRTIAIIPARGGSKRIPYKNIRKFNGLPLIVWTLVEAFKSFNIDDFYVSTEDDLIKEVLNFYSFKFIDRDPSHSIDTSSSDEVLEHTIRKLSDQNIIFDYVAFIQCTNPFDDCEVYDNVIQKLINNPFYDNSFASSIFKGWLWKRNEKNEAIGFNHDKNKRERSQDIDWDLNQERGSIVCFKKETFLKSKYRLSDKTLMVDCPNRPLIDIDTELDFSMAENIFIAHRKNRRKFFDKKVIFTDFDGVFSDNLVYTSSDNIENISSNKYDSLIIPLLKSKINIIVLTSEKNYNVKNRCEKIKLDGFFAVEDKKSVIKNYLIENNLNWDDVAYIGNDYNDLIASLTCGYSFCTLDSPEGLKRVVDEVIPVNGGNGVLRYLFEKYFNEFI
jgi:YrbI family 3-deoxy-D-manno-octulosonate 8-phosphate phosphatase